MKDVLKHIGPYLLLFIVCWLPTALLALCGAHIKLTAFVAFLNFPAAVAVTFETYYAVWARKQRDQFKRNPK